MYYSVIKLKKDSEIIISEKILKVDVDTVIGKKAASNDHELIAKIEEGYCNWVSGGGTYLINNKYIAVVKRPMDCAVNPEKFSLFTGRSDNHNEQVNPCGLVRELFEELVIYSGDKFLYPKCEKYQKIIDACYEDLTARSNLLTSEYIGLQLKEIILGDRSIEIVSGNKKEEINLCWHINQFNDVNVLFLFEVDIDVHNMKARDAEYHMEKGEPVFHNREIYLLDITSNQLTGISHDAQSADKLNLNVIADATEHLAFVLNIVKDKVN